MTGDAYEELEADLGAERVCAVCGHGERDHEEAEMGEAGAEWTRKEYRCLRCEDRHAFVPDQIEET